MKTMAVFEARNNFSLTLKAAKHDVVVVTRNGRPVAAIQAIGPLGRARAEGLRRHGVLDLAAVDAEALLENDARVALEFDARRG